MTKILQFIMDFLSFDLHTQTIKVKAPKRRTVLVYFAKAAPFHKKCFFFVLRRIPWNTRAYVHKQFEP